jgi:hypothetical protein
MSAYVVNMSGAMMTLMATEKTVDTIDPSRAVVTVGVE